jgi:hypothetical protein
MEEVDTFLWKFDLFTTNWYILWLFGTFCCHFVYVPRFGMLHQEQSGNPGANSFHIGSIFVVSINYIG